MSILGWLVVFAAVIAAYVFYRRSTAPAREGVTPPPDRAFALGSAILAVGLATWLFAAAPPSVADLKPTYPEERFYVDEIVFLVCSLRRLLRPPRQPHPAAANSTQANRLTRNWLRI